VVFSTFDCVVLATLVSIIILSQIAFARAGRSLKWRLIWLCVGLLFLVIEFMGAFTGNTFSENLVRSIPLWILEVGTVVVAVILMIHWFDLWNRIKEGLKWVTKMLWRAP
jgi:hypothetical protein